MTFTVIVYRAEEGGYWAEVPELPGCASQGETLDELKDNVTEAIEACLEARREDGDSDMREVVSTWSLRIAEGPDLIPA